MHTRKSNFYFLIILAVIISVLAAHLDEIVSGPQSSKAGRDANAKKLSRVLSYIDRFYVEDVNWDTTVEGAIEGVLETLDPHSVYITANQVQTNEENFEGRYEGIGIQFDIIDNYPTVIAVIPGSPSEKVGLQSGDKIIAVEGESMKGIKMSEVPEKLKGPKGSKVEVTIERGGIDAPFQVTIVRDEIPIHTIHTYFKADERTGYIWLNRFAQTTDREIEEAILNLEKSGMQRLILDLRGNGGGYLRQAVKIVGMFIEGHKKVVYTRGRLERFNNNFYTDDFGRPFVKDFPLIVMIDGSSASASEIVAGAIQDYDRGLIVGTNSFGKGLVQNEFRLQDKSRIRLTVSRYYTPSGRLIQKPYEGKERDEYYHDAVVDTADTVEVSEDSLQQHNIYQTVGGREVYGGGGIMPDVEVKYVSYSKNQAVTQKMYQNRIFFTVAARYAAQAKNFGARFERFMTEFKVSDAMLIALQKAAREQEIGLTDQMLKSDRTFLRIRLKAEIARNLWGMDRYYQVLLQKDNQYKQALELFPEALKIQALNAEANGEK